MASFRYVKCALADLYTVEGSPGNCYETKRYELPDGRSIEFREGGVYIDGKRVEYEYRGSFLYSDEVKRPLVRMLYMYSVDGVIIPEEGFAFFHVNSPVGPFTVVMYEDCTFVGVDTLVTVPRIGRGVEPEKMYIMQFISDVEREYFGREQFREYLRGVV